MSSRVIRANNPGTGIVMPLKLNSIAPVTASFFPRDHLPVSEAPVGVERLSLDTSQESVQESSHSIALLEKNAYETGFREGQKAAGDAGEKVVAPLLEQYSRSLEELKGLRRDVLASSEREVIRLALEIARKVVRREITVDEELILTLVRVALKRVSDQSVITVRLNPKDYSVVKRHQSMSNASDVLNDGIALEEDPLITRGGCVIETGSGLVDARVEEQLREIEKGFLD